MTEEEWLGSKSAISMLMFLRHLSSERKLRLAACAYCRSVWQLLNKASRRAVTLGEEMADGPIDESLQNAVVRAAIESVMRFDNTSGAHFFAADIAYRVPCNDGGISLGQAAIANARLKFPPLAGVDRLREKIEI